MLGPITLRGALPESLSLHYNCVPLTEFENTSQCNLKVSPSGTSQLAPLAQSVVKSADGQVLYAYFKSRASSSSAAQDIISKMRNSQGDASQRISLDGATVVIWGDVRLEAIKPFSNEYSEINGLVESKYGLLLTAIGNLSEAKSNHRPVYRVIGGDGLVAIVSQNKDKETIVQQFVVAAGALAEKNFLSQARVFLSHDGASSPSDLSAWPEIAFMTRRLALNTSPENANVVIDKLFAAVSSESQKKYYSHVWALLPTSVINHLRAGTYTAADVFSDKTEFPEIRNKILDHLKATPKERFSEFLLYTLGRFSDALEYDQNSPVKTVLAYALAHSHLRHVMSLAYQRVARPQDQEVFLHKISYKSFKSDESLEEEVYMEKTFNELNVDLQKRDFFNGHAYENITLESYDYYKDDNRSLNQYLNFLNQFPERYGSGPIFRAFPEFLVLTKDLEKEFLDVLKNKKSPHFDDAAYFLGWIAYHRGNLKEALSKFEIAIASITKSGSDNGNPGSTEFERDYAYPALHQTRRILRTLAPEEALATVENSAILSRQAAVWEAAMTSCYHAHYYKKVMSSAQKILSFFGVSVESLPVTTDPNRIQAAFTKLGLGNELSLLEIAYLYFSSREIQNTEDMLSHVNTELPINVKSRLKNIIIKYALINDPDSNRKGSANTPQAMHKDLRQSIYLADRALQSLPKSVDFSKFREWFHYKRIRLLALFDPTKVAIANAAFQAEFPNSRLLGDGIAEQVFSEGVIVGDMTKANASFEILRQHFPGNNAIDNAYSWIAIGWACVGQPLKAGGIDRDIIRLFPSTRHALYALARIKNPMACKASNELYLWDYQAMLWRERNRLDVLQEAFVRAGVGLESNPPRKAETETSLPVRESRPSSSGSPPTPVQPLAQPLRTPTKFNCANATLGVDFAVCANPKLMDAMARLEDAYSRARAAKGDEIRASQRAWSMHYGPDCGLPKKGRPTSSLVKQTETCVLRALNNRIDYLEGQSRAD
jgi:tetratricopeptide (TPR) repeat protein